ncbi:MAG: hypothetical protein IT191_08430 [Microbacteriaceae bacterium]|nr:hypothetical protein [Cryobacterium sp.]MCC6377030.1 hypothetical protein [Microbacteriaceae bacterium]
MALLHKAELKPSKVELLNSWAPSQAWFIGDAGNAIESIASFRFDDPAGKVGVETLLVRAGNGPTLQIPLTYREAPLAGAEGSLVGTLDHSVLGKRWVYDGAGDPIYLATAATVAISGGHQAKLEIEIDGKMIEREPTAVVSGSGTTVRTFPSPAVTSLTQTRSGRMTIVQSPEFVLIIQRVLDGSGLHWPADLVGVERQSALITGSWSGVATPQELVLVATHD